jgi:hypothetical protein
VSNYSKRELILLAAAIVVICMLAWIVMFAEQIFHKSYEMCIS